MPLFIVLLRSVKSRVWLAISAGNMYLSFKASSSKFQESWMEIWSAIRAYIVSFDRGGGGMSRSKTSTRSWGGEEAWFIM